MKGKQKGGEKGDGNEGPVAWIGGRRALKKNTKRQKKEKEKRKTRPAQPARWRTLLQPVGNWETQKASRTNRTRNEKTNKKRKLDQHSLHAGGFTYHRWETGRNKAKRKRGKEKGNEREWGA